MDQTGLLSHVAMSVDRATFTAQYVADLGFYCDLLGWRIDEKLSIENERLLIALPAQGQYLNVRALDHAMAATGYEHIGIYVESSEAVHALFDKVRDHGEKDDRVEITEGGVQTLYGGALTTFRFRFLLPVSVEIQHLRTASR